MFADPLIQRIAVVGFVADQSLRCFTEETPLERGFDKSGFIRRSADPRAHGREEDYGGRVAMILLPLPAFCRADTRARFFIRTEAGVDEGFAPIQLAAVARSLRLVSVANE